MYRNIFWDLGGTIVDTYPDVDAALKKVVEEAGTDVPLTDISHLTRVSTHHAIDVLSTQYGIDPALFTAATDAVKKSWETMPPWPIPCAEDLLVRAHRAGGKNLVVTNRDKASALTALGDMARYVDEIVCPEDGFPRKPDPAMFTYLLEKYDLDPADCPSIGDRPIDVEVAHKVGMKAVFLKTPGLDVEAPEADKQVQALAQLLRFIG